LPRGDASDDLLAAVYEELRGLAQRLFRRERVAHTLQPTALVHEVYLRLAEQNRVDWQGKTHLFAVGAHLMRRVLVDHARARTRHKRGSGAERVVLDEALVPGGDAALTLADLLAVHEALEQLAALDARQARIVEQRYFGGLTAAEIASENGVSQRTVEAELTHARAWLRRRLATP
jgi:RNA polymerase sigma-70 factor, ECF subfamily